MVSCGVMLLNKGYERMRERRNFSINRGREKERKERKQEIKLRKRGKGGQAGVEGKGLQCERSCEVAT